MNKILICHHSSELYGSDKILVEIIKILNNMYEATLMLPSEGLLNKKIQSIDINVNLIVNNKMPLINRALFNLKGLFVIIRNIKDMHCFLNKNQYDILYCNTLSCVLLLLLGKVYKNCFYLR